MTTQLTKPTNNALANALAPSDWTREYLDTIKAVFGKGCTDAEFALAVQASKTTGLRIDTRELWVYKRNANEPMTLTISIDGFRAIAHTSGVFAGEGGPFFCGEDGIWHEVWAGKGLPHAAKFTVWRTDFQRPFVAVILVSEFAKLGGFLWQKAPVWMAGIRVATHAYRKAFRQEIASREYQVQGLGVSLSTPETAIAAESDLAEPVVVDPDTGEVLGSSFGTSDESEIAEPEPMVPFEARARAYYEQLTRIATAAGYADWVMPLADDAPTAFIVEAGTRLKKLLRRAELLPAGNGK